MQKGGRAAGENGDCGNGDKGRATILSTLDFGASVSVTEKFGQP
jgi:hypothetical protein